MIKHQHYHFSLPHSHQYFIYEFYTKVKQDSDISDGMNSIKDNADFISELKSHLKNSEKLKYTHF